MSELVLTNLLQQEMKISDSIKEATKVIKDLKEKKQMKLDTAKKRIELLHNRVNKKIENEFSSLNEKLNEESELKVSIDKIHKELFNACIVDKERLVNEVLKSLELNTNKEWEFVETRKFGKLDFTILSERTLKPVTVQYFKEKSYKPKFTRYNTCFAGDAHYSVEQLIMAANGENIILLNNEYYRFKKDTVPLFILKNKNDAQTGLSINNEFYIEKYPYLKDILKSLININFENK